MKSPFANCEAQLRVEPAKVVFRGDEYEYQYHYYECDKTGERFTTKELDNENTEQVYSQYRQKYGIPSVEQIKEIKAKYNLTNTKLGQILGFGENQIAHYLDGEVPSKTNGRLMMALLNPIVFSVFLNLSRNQLGEKKYNKIKEQLEPA